MLTIQLSTFGRRMMRFPVTESRAKFSISYFELVDYELTAYGIDDIYISIYCHFNEARHLEFEVGLFRGCEAGT